MLAARPTMSVLSIVFSPLVAADDGTRKSNKTSCAIDVTGVSTGDSGAIAFELSPE